MKQKTMEQVACGCKSSGIWNTAQVKGILLDVERVFFLNTYLNLNVAGRGLVGFLM